MNYSYVMGVSNNILELMELGFTIEKDADDYMLIFDNNKKEIYENFICDNLECEYWNEYIGDNITFIFKFRDGSIKKYVLDDSNQE